jgi:hypothetical protein
VIDILHWYMINPSQLKWGARSHVQSMSLKSWNWRKTYMLFCFVVFFLHNFSLCFRMCGEREKVQQTRVRFLIALQHLNFASGFFWFLLLYLHLRMMIIWSSCSRCQKPPLPFHLWELVTLRWGDHSSLRRRDDLLSSIDSESIFNGRGDGGASCRTFLKISWTKIS